MQLSIEIFVFLAAVSGGFLLVALLTRQALDEDAQERRFNLYVILVAASGLVTGLAGVLLQVLRP